MRTVSFYHKDTGLIHGGIFSTSEEALIEVNTPPDHLPIEGAHDPLCRRVIPSTGEVVPYQPASPSPDYEWDDVTERWVLNAAAQAKIAKHQAALDTIARLELAQHRAMREFTLGLPGAQARLQAIDDEIAGLRKDL